MTKNRLISFTCIVSGLLAATIRAASLPGDAEAAAHGNEAANVQLVKETEQKSPDFVFRQYNLGVLSHYSYLVGSGGEAMIVDPARDISRYLKDTQELGLKITRVYLTHSHADFVAGHMELAKATGAEIIMNEAAKAGYPHKAVKDGDAITFGTVRAVIVTTPGHTPDGTCLYVYHPATAANPAFVFTGDTLFIGSVGRPDLMGEGMSAASLAEMGYHSWKDKLAKLPDNTRFFPAHGAGSLCGANLSDKPVSTIGEQRKGNVYLQHKDLPSYIMAVIDGLPDAPQYFKHNAKMNHDGPPLVDWEKTTPPALSPAEVAAQMQKGAWLVDLRDAAGFAVGHPADAINIGIRGRFETWTGIMIPWGEPFILTGSDADVREAAFRLKRIGYDAPAGYLQGGLDAWKVTGLPVRTVKLVNPADLYTQMQATTAPVIVDVRLPSEWMGLRIGHVLNLPLNKLFVDGKRLSKEMPVLTVCNSAYRSSMGAAVLLKMGFKDVLNMEGGGEAWVDQGLPTLGSTAAGAPAAPVGVYINLPDPIAPEELAKRQMDLPGTYEVVDIRPAWQFAEFNIPGSVNTPVEQVLNSPTMLADKRPLVLVCRDGSISATVAGALVQKVQRPVRFLTGGAKRYYDEILRPAGIVSTSTMLPQGKAALPAAPAVQPAVPAAAPVTPAPAPAAPKKKSAGC
jgi:glyoxylase-like metal-dependent hydrolase (beta-lactamase superfamily II)/rhodanese-related sulfurtransferase